MWAEELFFTYMLKASAPLAVVLDFWEIDFERHEFAETSEGRPVGEYFDVRLHGTRGGITCYRACLV